MYKFLCFILLFLFSYFPTSFGVAEEAENPVYKNWKDFAQGTSVTYSSITRANGVVTHQEFSLTLVEKTPDKIVIERQLAVVADDGSKTLYPAMASTNPRTYKLPKGAKPLNTDDLKDAKDHGTETLNLVDREIETEWTKKENRVEAGITYTQTWTSHAIPGALVKSISDTPATKSVTTVQLIALKLPKESQVDEK